METTLYKTYTQSELDDNYGDDLFAHDELIDRFIADNPDAKRRVASGKSEDNGDGTYTYTITIEYDIIA